MPNTIFFAWQLDTPSDQNKKFIWQALQGAAASIGEGAHPEMAPRPEMDTQGVTGAPNIVQTIFKRINACSVFVADLTFVGVTDRGRKVSNPNVLLELGFAARAIGWERTVLVLNEAFGDTSELPFDIQQHRWPIRYRLSAESQARQARAEELQAAISAALSACATAANERAIEMANLLDARCLDLIARHELAEQIDMHLPADTMAGLVLELSRELAIRRLVDLGALRVVPESVVTYRWTHDGRLMIERIKMAQPDLLAGMRQIQAETTERVAARRAGVSGKP